MNTQEICHILYNEPIVKNQLIGVIAKDQLPQRVMRYPCAIISNIDSSFSKGRHWIAFYIDENENGEFFDSYGHDPLFYNSNFVNFLNDNCKKWKYNSVSLQNMYSNVCGEYSVAYLIYRCRNIALSTFVNMFSQNSVVNDIYVNRFVISLIDSHQITVHKSLRQYAVIRYLNT